MIYYGMEPRPNLGARMVLTDLELRRLNRGKLRSDCVEDGHKFVCYFRVKGNKVRIGSFNSIEDCNKAWDLAKRAIRTESAIKTQRLSIKEVP